jgi:peptidoglycan/LPS O-acetylase OafA/YrhL
MQRISHLDSLRGAAALVVLFQHVYLCVPEHVRDVAAPRGPTDLANPWVLLRWTPAHLAISGQAAVILFFVLSGFVLSPMVERWHGFRRYAARRWARIWLPFAIAILAAAWLCATLGGLPIPESSAWLAASWADSPSWQLIGAHLAMAGTDWADGLDNPVWSLVVEMRLSLLFPLLFLAVRWQPVPTLASLTVLYPVLSSWAAWRNGNYAQPNDVATSLLWSSCYAVFFGAGAAMYLSREVIDRAWNRLPRTVAAALTVIGLTLLSVPAVHGQNIAFEITAGGGAVLTMAAALASPSVRHLLALPPLRWLGAVSYSLYLTHVVVLLTVAHAIGGPAPVWWPVGAALLALPVAAAFHYFVEDPALRLSRRLGRSSQLLAATAATPPGDPATAQLTDDSPSEPAWYEGQKAGQG